MTLSDLRRIVRETATMPPDVSVVVNQASWNDADLMPNASVVDGVVKLYVSEADPEYTFDPPKETLSWDHTVSDRFPVVTGTWVTTDMVTWEILEGKSWSDVMRIYPELTEDDIRACISYEIESGSCS